VHVHGSHRPITRHDEAPGPSTPIEAEVNSPEEARSTLEALVPEGHQLLHVVVDR
jgi:hypothetical protein